MFATMKIGVLKEEGRERRVALHPQEVKRLSAQGIEVFVQSKAGEGAFIEDKAYEEAGATIVADEKTLIETADIILTIHLPSAQRSQWMKPKQVWIGLFNALDNAKRVAELAQKQITMLSLDRIPRITRAQSVDVLSSMAAVAGYKAALLCADYLPKFFPMLTTAAGTVAPAKVFVLGAGVAGLQAIATAKRLGAKVYAMDVRPETKEEVESLGATFVAVPEEAKKGEGGYAAEQSRSFYERQQQVLAELFPSIDAVITTALIPGRPAPKLIPETLVEKLPKGSVIVDLAAPNGGNCTLTQPDEIVQKNGVTIIGYTNLPSMLAPQATQLFSKNLFNLLQMLIKDQSLQWNFEDEIIDKLCIVYEGNLRDKDVEAKLQ